MDGWLKQSTAVTLKIGPFVDSANGNDEETALTIAQADVRLSKNGGNMAQKNESTSCTHDELGIYDCPIDTTDTDTLGRLELSVHETGSLVVRHTYMVVPANVWDSMFGADKLDVSVVEWLGTAAATPTVAGVPEVDVTHWIGTAAATPTVAGVPEVDITHLGGAAQSATDLKDFADDGYDPATNKVQGVLLADTVTTYTGNTPQTGDAFARIGLPAGASVSADIAAIEAQTDDIGTAGAGLTAVPWNAAWDAEVESEVNDALVVHRLDELVNADSDIDGAAPPTVGSVFHELLTKTTGSFTYDQTTDSLEAVRDKLTDIETDTAEIGAAGAGLTNINLPNQTMDIVGNITGNLSGSVGSVTGAVGSVAGAVGSVTGNVGGNVTGSVGSVTGLTPGTIADQVWEEAIADHSGTSGSTAEALDAASAGSDPAAIADAVWDEAIAGHLGAGSTGLALNSASSAGDPWATAVPGAYGAGTAGAKLGRVPDVAAGAAGGLFIAGSNAATTVNVTGNLTGNVSGSVGSVTGAVGSVTGAVGSVTGNVGGNVVGSVASVTAGVTLAASAVQAVWDALTSALTTVGSIGKLLVDNINATISSRATPAQVNTEVDTALADYDAPTSAELVSEINSVQSDIAALNNLSAAQVNAEVVDALNVDTYAEPGQEAPPATTTLVKKIGYLHKAFRNKLTQSATEAKLFADDGTTVDQKATVSDSGTEFTRGEFTTGP